MKYYIPATSMMFRSNELYQFISHHMIPQYTPVNKIRERQPTFNYFTLYYTTWWYESTSDSIRQNIKYNCIIILIHYIWICILIHIDLILISLYQITLYHIKNTSYFIGDYIKLHYTIYYLKRTATTHNRCFGTCTTAGASGTTSSSDKFCARCALEVSVFSLYIYIYMV